MVKLIFMHAKYVLSGITAKIKDYVYKMLCKFRNLTSFSRKFGKIKNLNNISGKFIM